MVNKSQQVSHDQPIEWSRRPLIEENGISSVRIELRTSHDDVLAYVSFSFYGMIQSGIKIIKGKKGLFIKYPSELQDNGVRKYYMHPSNRAVNSIIERVIFREYDKTRQEYLRKLGVASLCK